jgi:hypothetical protein
MRRFALFSTVKASTGLDYVALRTKLHAYNINIIRPLAGD